MKKYEEGEKKALSAAIIMIRRNLSRLESQELKTLWFRLLDTVMKPLGDLEAACKQNTSAYVNMRMLPASTKLIPML